MKIYNGYKRLNENYTLLTDEYEYTMANTYLTSRKENQEAVFDVFFRKIPNGGGYVVMAGLDKVIEYISNLKFGERELNYFRRKGYSDEFLKYLSEFKNISDVTILELLTFNNGNIDNVKLNLIDEDSSLDLKVLYLANAQKLFI